MKITLFLSMELGFISIIFAQMLDPAPFMEKKVQQSQLVFEGKIISVTSVADKAKHEFQNINYVLVSKWFKGNPISDTIKVFSISEMPSATIEDGGLPLGNGLEGIFFCVPIRPEEVKYIGINVYRLIGNEGFISLGTYRSNSRIVDYNHKVSNAIKLEKLERTVYDSIEQFSGQKYIKLRLNGLE